MAKKRKTYAVEDGSFSECKSSIRVVTHAVLAEHAKEPNKGKTAVLVWSGSEGSANRAAKELAGKSWAGAWDNVRVRPVTVM